MHWLGMDIGGANIKLADGAARGASGGGVFWQGAHIGHNWRVEEGLDCEGNVVISITIVALNGPAVADGDYGSR